ncbi:hypothetical protein [Amaricoccus sp.]|uniref:hypothetical protein n=1 Tax=Amaricoccus sp. TaxID=1872485 RepID=UPI001B57F5E0|nr:hypothetical protein [Amaricoccus sp.]MBP7241443.1 hypothetical protein [Amaricoccus sp.]
MRISFLPALLAGSTFCVFAPVAAVGADEAAIIASAESAAPAAIAKEAAVVTVDAEGHMTTLREGQNGYTCIPDVPETPGPDPMCADQGWMGWMKAWMAHEPPPQGLVGMGYMLAGGSDPDNLDPFALQPSSGRDWVTTGPHLMVFSVGADLSAYPGGAQPDTTKPYVMYPDTPYAHLMLPLQ